VIDLVSVLNPLSSNNNKYNWTSENDDAFKRIKEILNRDLNYQEPDSEESVKIIYSDTLESTRGATLFSYDIIHYRLDPLDFLSNLIPEKPTKNILCYTKFLVKLSSHKSIIQPSKTTDIKLTSN